MKANNYVQIDVDIYEGLLDDRYDVISPLYGNEASRNLWEDFKTMYLMSCGDLVDDPKFVVDNYLINGEFVYRDDYEDNYSTYIREHFPDFDDIEDEDERWEKFCEDCLIHSDEYALRQC